MAVIAWKPPAPVVQRDGARVNMPIGFYERVPEQCGFGVILPELRISMPGASDDILLNYLRDASIDFARRTGMLKRVSRIKLERDRIVYVPGVDEQERIAHLNWVKLGNHCLRIRRTCNGCSHGYDFGQWSIGFVYHHPDAIELTRVPHECYVMEIEVTAAPIRAACQADCNLLDEGKAGILALARAELYLLPSTTWFDPKLAADARAMGSLYVDKARGEFATQNAGGVFRGRAVRV